MLFGQKHSEGSLTFKEKKAKLREWINRRTEGEEGFTALHFAAFHGNLTIVRYLMDLGGDIHVKNHHNINLMHVSAQGDQATSIVFLQRQGLDINSRDRKNSTPLHWASYAGAETAIVYLLAFGALVNSRDAEGHTPLHLAVKSAEESKSTRAVKHLLLRGSDRSIQVHSNN